MSLIILACTNSSLCRRFNRGILLLFWPNGTGVKQIWTFPTGFDDQFVDNGVFREIIITADMFSVHMPGPYVEACKRLS